MKARKWAGSEQEVIQLMESHENKLNEETRLCVVRRWVGLIEGASWVKGKRRGSLSPFGSSSARAERSE